MSVAVDLDRCPQDHPCPAVNICKMDALSQEGCAAPAVDDAKCEDCGRCVRFCPRGALQPKAANH